MEKKSYAIKCSTEEQARECKEKGYTTSGDGIYFIRESKTIPVISYEEAFEKGLLGETTEQQSDVVEKREKRYIELQTFPHSEIHKAMRNEVGRFLEDLKHLSSK